MNLAYFACIHNSYHDAQLNFIQALQERQGLMVACVEEIAYRMGYIDAATIAKSAQAMRGNEYGKYLLRMLEQENAIRNYR